MIKKQSTTFAIIDTFLWKFGIQFFSILKHIVIAGYIGLSIQLDIFYIALAIFGVFITSWMLVFDNIAIPKLVDFSTENDWANFKKLGSSLIGFSFILSILFLFILLFFPQQISLLAFGFNNEEKIILQNKLIWLLPAVLFYLPLGASYSILKSARQFSLFNRCEFLGNLSILIFLYLFFNDENVLYWSFSFGISLSFAISFIFIFLKFSIYPRFPFEKNLRALFPLMPPLLLIHSSYYLFVMTDRFFVTYLNNGDISALTYATVLTYAIPQLLSIATYFLTSYSEEKTDSEKNRKFNETVSLVILIGLPTTIFFIFTSENIISMLLQRGAFNYENSILVSMILSVLCLAIIPLCIQPALDQIYQAERKLKRIIFIKIVSFVINILLNTFFIFLLDLGVIGAALGTVISYWIMLSASLIDIKYFKMQILWKKHIKWFLWIFLFNCPLLVISNFKLVNYDLNFLNIIIYVFLITLLNFFSVISYFGEEKSLFIKTIDKFFSKNDY